MKPVKLIPTIGFILEQTLGHCTHSQNLQMNVAKDATVHAVWGLLTWETTGIAARMPLYNSNWTVRAGLRARQAITQLQRRTPMDLLFIHTQVAALFATPWLRSIPSIVSLDATPLQYDNLGEHYAHARNIAWLEHQKWRLNCHCFRQARRLVTWSHWTKQSLVDDYDVPDAKIIVIPPGVNAQAWRCPTARTLRSGPVRILFVGGDLKRKGGLLLLEAFRALRQQAETQANASEPALELHLVTHDTWPPEPGLFIYNNLRPNSDVLKKLFHTCDIFCLPTYGDCLPMVLSEAGAAGLPTIATRVGAIAEIVEDGETGFLIPTGSVPALIETLQRLIENPTLRLQQGERAVAKVHDAFDAEHNTERLLALMKQMTIKTTKQ